MTTYTKVFITETEFKIRQSRDDGTVRWVDADHAGFLRWKEAGNRPEIIEYVPPIIPSDDDPTLLAAAKKAKIQTIRDEFSRMIKDEYDSYDIGLKNMAAITAVSKGNALPTAFVTMKAYIDPVETWRNTEIQEVKACTLVSQVNAITTTR